ARLSRPPSARRPPFAKRSPGLPRVPTCRPRALVRSGRFFPHLRALAPALLAQSQAQWRAQSPTQTLAQTLARYTWAKEMLAARAQSRSRRLLGPARLPVRRMILRNQRRL